TLRLSPKESVLLRAFRARGAVMRLFLRTQNDNTVSRLPGPTAEDYEWVRRYSRWTLDIDRRRALDQGWLSGWDESIVDLPSGWEGERSGAWFREDDARRLYGEMHFQYWGELSGKRKQRWGDASFFDRREGSYGGGFGGGGFGGGGFSVGKFRGADANGMVALQGRNAFGSAILGKRREAIGADHFVIVGLTPQGGITQDLNIPIEGFIPRFGWYPTPVKDAWQSLLYERPHFSGDWRVFSDLLAYAPGMNTQAADIAAVLDDEAPDPQAAPGNIDPAARVLIQKASQWGWQSITLPTEK